MNTTYTYDPASSLLSVLHKLGTTTIDGASYTYDNAEISKDPDRQAAKYHADLRLRQHLPARNGQAGFCDQRELHL